MQLKITHTTLVPREVQRISTTRVPVTVPPYRVPEIGTPLRVMISRSPMITQEDPIDESIHRYTVEHNNQHPLKHRYPTRITQMSQEINQVEGSSKSSTRHQH